MSLLNFDTSSSQPKGKKKSLKIVIGIGALVGVIALGSTLASSINLNTGKPVEFGQGIAETTACDNDITVTPFSTFVNETGAGSYKFTSLKINGINSSSDKCDGKTFVIKAYGDSGIINLFSYADSANPEDDSPYNTIEIANDGGLFTWISDGAVEDAVTQGPSGDLTNTSFTLNFASNVGTITRTPFASAEEVKGITIETFNTIATPVAVATEAAITTQPTGAVSGSSLTQQPVIRIVDANGSTVTSSTVDVVASIATGTGLLTGTTTVAAVAGIATFTNLVVTGDAGDFTLTFTPTSLTPITSNTFSITAAEVTYGYGDVGPGGGRIIYVAGNPGFLPLFNCGPTFSDTGSPTNGQCKYLEAAPIDGVNAWTDVEYQWSPNTNTEIGSSAQGTATGTGYRNTMAMVLQSGGPSLAAFNARIYRGPNDLSDWYLPSSTEIFWMFMFQTSALGWKNGEGYWTSTENDSGSARSYRDGSTDYPSKSLAFFVRPVRAF